ncbi:MAG: electron transfer flavoprotein subunit alpha/FixB family protein [Clostridiales bacterium]|nr:electron transfer flavoprotein subunit alpha/FixB family protein [Clostridiales bacterium]
MNRDVWVFVEDSQGKPKNVGLELLSGPGRRLAVKQGGQLCAVVISHAASAAVQAAVAYGADIVYVIEGSEYEVYTTDAYTDALSELIQKKHPTTVLIGATVNGRDLGPRLACRLRTGLTADCTGLDIDEASGHVAWTRPAFGGNLMATILCPDHRPQIGTVRPGVFKLKTSPDITRQAKIIVEDIHVKAQRIRTKILETIGEASDELVDLEGAEIIVSGGRGLGKAENFSYIRELAKVLDATVGASRATVDAGWISHVHQVGQTGKTVGPKLYIAAGISGAVQHLVGIGGADKILAINKDIEAPIFNVADYSIHGDLFEILPAITEEVKKLKGLID